jgi:hypothetical protein
MDITADYQQLQQSIELSIADFHQQADVNRLVQQLRCVLFTYIEQQIASAIQQLLCDRHFLVALKALAAKSALRFKGFKPTSIRLISGQSISIDSPYFAKMVPKAHRGRKSKKRKAKTGCHLGLSYLGLIDRCSGILTSAAVKAALLCPSFDVAKRTLLSFGIQMDIKTIQRLCLAMGSQAIENRHRIALSDADGVDNRTLFVCIDGGRLRERTPKRGRRSAGQKRQGYHTDWREPTQIVIQWLDADGEKCKQTVPLYDATMGDVDAAFELLEGYLRQIGACKADMVIFCADGARRYWTRFSSLAKKLKINAHLEIIDYTHAKQNLKLVADQLPKKLGDKKLAAIFKDWKNLLWHGKLGEIHSQIRQFVKSQKKRKFALNKFKNYFLKNYRRMQYFSFRHLDMPTGSGSVESAIRRVINLRLKSPGIFWKRKTAEVMLFLRSALLCGRWDIMLNNLLALNRGQCG